MRFKDTTSRDTSEIRDIADRHAEPLFDSRAKVINFLQVQNHFEISATVPFHCTYCFLLYINEKNVITHSVISNRSISLRELVTRLPISILMFPFSE